jgi:hypothetical protein
MDAKQAHHQKLKKIFDEVLLNYEAQQKWEESVDPDFIACVETMTKRYNQNLSKEQWLRTGVMLGAVYEQWRQQQEGKNE